MTAPVNARVGLVSLELVRLAQHAPSAESFWPRALGRVRALAHADCVRFTLGSRELEMGACPACRALVGAPRGSLQLHLRSLPRGHLVLIRHGPASFGPDDRRAVAALGPTLSLIHLALCRAGSPERDRELAWFEGNLRTLAPREAEVAHWVAHGLSDREIAQRLGRSLHTVRNQVAMVFSKLGVNRRVELARAYARVERSHRGSRR